jgi:catechol 2,3-dioxygenase-like lactoylglutathione lyase family enzyme
MAPKISFIKETGIYIDDLDSAEKFYKKVFGLEPFTKREGRHIFYKIGDTILLIFNPKATIAEHFLPPHGTSGSGHIAFEIEPEDVELWREHLKKCGVEILKETSFGGGISLYFRDPGNNLLELITRGSWENSKKKTGIT